MVTLNAQGAVTPISDRVMNLSGFMSQSARRLPTHEGLAWGDKSWTWAELEARVEAMALVLSRDFGVQKGDRLLVQSQNCNQMFEAMFACFRVGAVWVPANFRQTPDEVAYLGQSSGASLMLCNKDFPDHAKACLDACPDMKSVIAIGEADFGPDYDALLETGKGESFPAVAVNRHDPCWFFFTSGTTGRPKAGVLTHGQMAFVITNHLCDLMPGTTHNDASLVVAPLSHGAGVHQLTQVARGAATVLLGSERFDVPLAWKTIQDRKITNLFLVPTILKLLVEDPSVDQFDHSSLRYVIYAGAPMYREDQKFALNKLGKVLVQYFGLGEVTGNITVFPPDLHELEDGPKAREGTCGYARTGMEISIRDDKGKEVAQGSTGEICLIGPAVFAGYYNNPEANEKAFVDGWFRTGDLGYLDDEGFLYITGRASDMYISGGSNIYPREIEEKILQHPAVAEVAVLGVPDAKWGEVGVAVCVLSPGQALSEQDLLDSLRDKISGYKLPKRAFFWPELPKSGYGKITKKLVREELEARGDLA
ncbi:acyl-CoA synthetase [Rhodovibrionaceae bacterium A322]